MSYSFRSTEHGGGRVGLLLRLEPGNQTTDHTLLIVYFDTRDEQGISFGRRFIFTPDQKHVQGVMDRLSKKLLYQPTHMSTRLTHTHTHKPTCKHSQLNGCMYTSTPIHMNAHPHLQTDPHVQAHIHTYTQAFTPPHLHAHILKS